MVFHFGITIIFSLNSTLSFLCKNTGSQILNRLLCLPEPAREQFSMRPKGAVRVDKQSAALGG